MVEVNFLCVHKKLRFKRVAPVLIKEITRQVHKQGIFQAIYSTSAVLPKPIASSRYERALTAFLITIMCHLNSFLCIVGKRSWHRSLNPRKLIELNFSSLTNNMTLQRVIKLNRLPEVRTPFCGTHFNMKHYRAVVRSYKGIEKEQIKMLGNFNL